MIQDLAFLYTHAGSGPEDCACSSSGWSGETPTTVYVTLAYNDDTGCF